MGTGAANTVATQQGSVCVCFFLGGGVASKLQNTCITWGTNLQDKLLSDVPHTGDFGTAIVQLDHCCHLNVRVRPPQHECQAMGALELPISHIPCYSFARTVCRRCWLQGCKGALTLRSEGLEQTPMLEWGEATPASDFRARASATASVHPQPHTTRFGTAGLTVPNRCSHRQQPLCHRIRHPLVFDPHFEKQPKEALGSWFENENKLTFFDTETTHNDQISHVRHVVGPLHVVFTLFLPLERLFSGSSVPLYRDPGGLRTPAEHRNLKTRVTCVSRPQGLFQPLRNAAGRAHRDPE